MMKTLLINDPRYRRHVGEELGMQQVEDACKTAGLSITDRLTESDCRQSVVAQLEATDFELMLMCGGGDTSSASVLDEAITWAKDHGKRAAAINVAWSDDPDLAASLSSMERVFCVTEADTEAARRAGLPSTHCPHTIFATSTTLPEIIEDEPEDDHHHHGDDDGHGDPVDYSGYEQILIIDSPDRRINARLSKLAYHNALPFLHMDRLGYNSLRERWFVRTGGYTESANFIPKFLHAVARANRALSGRVLGTCLGMVFGVPTIGLSMDHKPLYADIGLDETLLLSKPERSLQAMESTFQALEAKQPSVDAYVAKARETIQQTFANLV